MIVTSPAPNLVCSIALAVPALLLGSGTPSAYAQGEITTPPPPPLGENLAPSGGHAPIGGNPIIADFSPVGPPGFGSPEAAPFPGPAIADYMPPAPPITVWLGPDNPFSRDYVPALPGIPIPTFPSLP
jgi:hypothetical protein